MILQSLQGYYKRMEANPDSDIAPEGFEWKEMPFVIVLDENGVFVDFRDRRQPNGKFLRAKPLLVPKGYPSRPGTQGWQKSNILWDHYGYVLAHPKSVKPDDVEMARKQHGSFKKLVDGLHKAIPDDSGIAAVSAYLDQEDFSRVLNHPSWKECSLIKGCNITFQLVEGSELVCQSALLIQHIKRQLEHRATVESGESGHTAVCLVTGNVAEIARLHFPISGINDKPAPFSAVNDGVSPAFSSYGKSQGYNFPISETAVFQYSEALNNLLKKSPIRVAGQKIVCWSEKLNGSAMEELFGTCLNNDDPLDGVKKVQSLFASINTGAKITEDDDQLFFVLYLAPNSARIVVRYWLKDTIREVGSKLAVHFRDLAIIAPPNFQPYLPLWQLLQSIAAREDSDNIPPNLTGDTMRAILSGTPYPATLLQAAIRRIRAEQAKKNDKTGKPLPNVTYARAALIKACLNRASRFKNQQEDITVSLDTSNSNPAYRLGRLFAVLEKIQEDAAKPAKLNSTIRDRFYGAASSSPVTAFPTLLKLKNHHLAKLSAGQKVHYEKLIGEIVWELGPVVAFPAQLPLPEQGRFAIGYYHQQRDLYTKK